MASNAPFHPKKAYLDADFLNSPDARPIRILAEYLEPQERFDQLKVRDTILFFGSARILSRESALRRLEEAKAGRGHVAAAERMVEMSRYYEDTRTLAHRLTEWSKGLKGSGRRFVVCSGGGPGIMEAANRGASEARGDNIGLCISLPFESTGNAFITRKLAFEFHYFFMRKYWFLYLAKAMVIMPGGFGTMDELFEALTLIQTRKMKKQLPIVLFGTRYWSEVMNLEAMAHWGTIDEADLGLVFRTDSVDEAFDFITRELVTYHLGSPGPTL
ncbi:MAG: LOG family protein [Rhodospirillales bacterium]